MILRLLLVADKKAVGRQIKSREMKKKKLHFGNRPIGTEIGLILLACLIINIIT